MDGRWMRAWGNDWLPLLVLLAALAASQLVLRWWRQRRRRSIAKRALGAERAALSLLRHRGYTVLETQVRRVWTVQHGANQCDVQLRADALVKRGSRKYIAEVKSTAMVADLKHGPTRRQLLEYAIAYGVDGVLLIDMHTKDVEEVTFPGLAHAPVRHAWPLVGASAVLFLVGLWLATRSMCWIGGSALPGLGPGK